MQKEEQQLEKRLSELSNLAYSRDIVTYSDFLNLNELNILHSMPKDRLYTKFVTFGGYGLAERQMAAFLPDALSLRGEMSWCSEEEWGDYPFDILRISPLHAKYAEQLTHRDYLGTILGLGIERAKIGDILVDGTDAVVFVHRTLQSFLMEELTRVRHTQVLVKEISREDFQYEPKYGGVCSSGQSAFACIFCITDKAFGSHRRGKSVCERKTDHNEQLSIKRK